MTLKQCKHIKETALKLLVFDRVGRTWSGRDGQCGQTWMGSLSLGRVVSTAIIRRRRSTISMQICSPMPGRCTFSATSSPVLLRRPLYTCT